MAEKVRRVDYYYTQVPDTPGEAFKILSRLKESKVNLTAFSAFPTQAGKTQVDLVPEKADALLTAAKSAGITLSERKQGFLIDGDDRVGAVADIMKRLSEAKINVTAIDAVCTGGGRYGAILWVKPTAYDAAAKALGI